MVLSDYLYNNRLHYIMLTKLYETEQSRNQQTSQIMNTFFFNRARARRRPARNYIPPFSTAASPVPPLTTEGFQTTTTTQNTATTQTVAPSLSITDIINHTTLYIYQDISTNFSICSISREPFQSMDMILKINSCGHIFKRRPFLNWVSRSSTCPLCRVQIVANSPLPPPPPPPPPSPPPPPPQPPVQQNNTDPIGDITRLITSFSGMHI